MKCIYCSEHCYKRGQRKEIQRYQCKKCGKYQQATYTKQRIPQEKYDWVVKLNNEGCGISSIGRLLRIAKSSVQRLIERIAATIKKPLHYEINQCYEMDELYTYCHHKANECWIIYAINRTTGAVVDFCVGRRTKENVRMVVDSVLILSPKRIYTDKLNIYPPLIPKPLHKIFKYCTNKIERHNLTLRTRLKRLSRKTLCFSKSEVMLENCVKIYWRR